jgi:iron complex transport system permease protein
MKHNHAIIVALSVLLACILLSMSVGRYPLKATSVLQLIGLKIQFREPPKEMSNDYIVFWFIRLPRVLMSSAVGAVLAIAGTVFQGLFRNPLVSPDILGVSAGAGFGAGLAILLFGKSTAAIQTLAFAFGLLAVVIAYTMSRHTRSASVTTLVLSGIIISALFSAGLSFLKYVADPYEELPAIVFWTMGSFSNILWSDLAKTFPIMAVCVLILFVLRWKLNVLTLGDDDAMALGIDVDRAREIYVFLATLMVASSVSSCGTISWVGLVIPHMARLIVGPDHSVLLPFAGIVGASFMVLMDTLARSISGGEIPISIMTSLIGAPFLGYLMLKQEKSQWDD